MMFSQSIIDQINELIECPICTDVMIDPRILPCVHTYCLKCLESLTNSQQGAEILCPVCRSTFPIPKIGVEGFPKNFFIAKICDLHYKKMITDNTKSLCVMCEHSNTKSEIKFYCMECEQNFCEHCSKTHTKIKVAEHHRLIEISKVTKDMCLSTKKTEKCAKHQERYLEIYCESCKLIICLVCFTEEHKLHNITDVKTLSNELQTKLEKNNLTINNKRDYFKCQLDILKYRQNNFFEDTEKIAVEIDRKSQELKQLIDNNVLKLKRNLEYLKIQENERISEATKEIDDKLTILTSFVKYNDELINRGNDADIIEGFEDLDKRANSLMKDDIDYLPIKEKFLDYKFCNSYTSAGRCLDHILGTILETDYREEIPKKIGCDICDSEEKTNDLSKLNISIDEVKMIDINNLGINLSHVKKFSNCPIGITAAFDDLICLIFRKSNIIEIYESMTWIKMNDFKVPDLIDPCDITFTDSYLLISEYNRGFIHCINLKDFICTGWPYSFEGINRISTLRNGNVLIISRQWNKLVEYNYEGTRIRDVVLPSDTRYVQNAIDFGHEQFLIYHGRSKMFNITIVSNNGEKLKSFSGTSYFNLNAKSLMVKLPINKLNFCLVYDGERHSFYILDSNLDYVKELKCLVRENFIEPICFTVLRMEIDCNKNLYLLSSEGNKLEVMKFD